MMNFIFLLLLIIQTITSHVLSIQNPLCISLGEDCEAATYLRTFGLRDTAFPFDWIISRNFATVCQVIEEHFRHFLQRERLRLRPPYHLVNNDYYNIQFVHDFPTTRFEAVSLEDENNGHYVVLNYLDYLDQVQNKYAPRIDRFLKALSQERPILFFRTHIKPDQAIVFVNLMTKLYPQLDYHLIAVHTFKEFDYEWHIPHVKNIYITERGLDHLDEWEYVFKVLELDTQITRLHQESPKDVLRYCLDSNKEERCSNET